MAVQVHHAEEAVVQAEDLQDEQASPVVCAEEVVDTMTRQMNHTRSLLGGAALACFPSDCPMTPSDQILIDSG